MLLAKKNVADNIVNSEIGDLKYAPIPWNNEWKIQLAKELLDIKSGTIEMKLFDNKDLDEVLNYVTTS